MNPILTDRKGSVSEIGESALIARIKAALGEATPPPPRGMGDDCDSVVYGKHFDGEAEPELVGAKLLKRNLSDIAAMGGVPCDAVVALFAPPLLATEWVERFAKGLAKCALDYSVAIVGGDVAESPTLAASLTLTGRARRPLTRGTGAAGDVLCVTGPLGGSIRGHHLTFTPRIEQGLFLGMSEAVTSCMDLSDGLAKDAPALAGDALAAVLDVADIPPSQEALEIAEGDAGKLAQSVLSDGEDYELLFAVKPEEIDAFEEAWIARFGAPFFRIGLLAERGDGAGLIDSATGKAPENAHGYEHLR
jgi:thiamine-monophosphate kinase